MRIAIFTDSFLPQINGVTIGTMKLVEELPKHEFLIVAPDGGSFSWKPKNCKTVLISPSIALPTYKDYRVCFFVKHSAWKQIEEFKPDLVFCQTPFFIGKLGLKLAKKSKIPSIGYYNTLLPDFLVYLPLPVIKNTQFAKDSAWKFGSNFYNSCNIVLANSKVMSSELTKHGLLKKPVLLPWGIEELFFKAGKKAKKDPKHFKLVFMGRVSFEKNIEVLVKSFALLEKAFPNLRLVIIGDGPARKGLESLCIQLGVKDKVEFAGMISGEKRALKLASCNLYLTASTIETQGIVNYEAMAAGLPAIAADAMANPEAVQDGFNGFLFKPFNEKDCAEKIEKVLKSKVLQKKLGKNAVKFAEDYKWKKIAGKFERLFKETEKKS
ncbi:MAG: glycosyltransferase [Candidatus Diapherotrites archaeon]|nr:glycosyltransferase [Candidatus Diapherotrites archaeon]